jgi:hypothetical protein
MEQHNYVVKDSGKRQTFDSGAVRDTATDKPRPDLLSPFFLDRLGHHMRKGAEKYEEWNWAKGIPNSRCYESLMRHLMQFAQGDLTEDHLSAAAFNIMAIIHNQEVQRRGIEFIGKGTGRGLCDMPVFTTAKITNNPINKEDYE